MALSVEIQKRMGAFHLTAQLEAGDEHLALLGASGSGKSVTLKCIAGILKPDAGRIELNGRVLFDSAAGIDLPPQKRRVGYLFQSYALFPHMTVRQNIAVAAQNGAAVPDLLRRFQLTEVAEQKPRQLSGGQQQRTALARILASEPEAILLDEPFSALDSFLKYQLELELAETLERFSGPVLWVSHDRGEVFRNCRRVCVVDQGTAQPATTREELFRHPGTIAAARLSGCKNDTAAVPEGDFVRLSDWGVRLFCGGPVPPQVTAVGIRSHHVHLTDKAGENTLRCAVVRVIEDVFGVIVLLRPVGAVPDAPPLRMELSKGDWQAASGAETVLVHIAPDDILLLN